MWGPGGGGDSTDWELSKENVQPLRQGRRVDVLNTSLQTAADEQTAQKIAEQRRSVIRRRQCRVRISVCVAYC